MARRTVRRPHPLPSQGLYHRSRFHAGPGNRGQYRDLQRGERRADPTAAVPRFRPPGRCVAYRSGARLRSVRHLTGHLLPIPRAERSLRGHRVLRTATGQPDRRRRSGAGAHRHCVPFTVLRARRAAAARSCVHGSRGCAQRSLARGHEPRPLGAAVWGGPQHHRPNHPGGRRGTRGDRGDAGRLSVPQRRHGTLGPHWNRPRSIVTGQLRLQERGAAQAQRHR